jgi:hypothetical protein
MDTQGKNHSTGRTGGDRASGYMGKAHGHSNGRIPEQSGTGAHRAGIKPGFILRYFCTKITIRHYIIALASQDHTL